MELLIIVLCSPLSVMLYDSNLRMVLDSIDSLCDRL